MGQKSVVLWIKDTPAILVLEVSHCTERSPVQWLISRTKCPETELLHGGNHLCQRTGVVINFRKFAAKNLKYMCNINVVGNLENILLRFHSRNTEQAHPTMNQMAV